MAATSPPKPAAVRSMLMPSLPLIRFMGWNERSMSPSSRYALRNEVNIQ